MLLQDIVQSVIVCLVRIFAVTAPFPPKKLNKYKQINKGRLVKDECL